MSNFKSQQITKPSYVKTKAYGLCGTLALATALVFGATVSADETTQPVADTQPAAANVYTADNAGNVTVTPSETVAPVETPVAEAPASKEVPKTAVYGGTLPSTGEKEGIASTLGLVVIAAGITALTLGFKKYNGKEDK
ncbi:LPXTG cell wall anchor domain-containing protein [uncultured Streptococcus sp.]|uniref:LPXTG cell wall anchor domain-containing protein n=1 Tax=uncultured Streptococcus sp. TaxID=83427 RepID=UPI002675D2FE|nr:LPXTG cell wall anchor domain-containing protein [uncultured Streptococcus sp.]